jgi:hypothetical protein
MRIYCTWRWEHSSYIWDMTGAWRTFSLGWEFASCTTDMTLDDTTATKEVGAYALATAHQDALLLPAETVV